MTMATITKCYIGMMGTSQIAMREGHATCSMFIMSSFQNAAKISPFGGHILNADRCEPQNPKSRFAKMLSRSIKTEGDRAMEYVALYEDFAKVEALTDDEESYHDLAQSGLCRTSKRFDTLEAAVEWASKAVADYLTVYGCGEVREIEPVKRRCRYCICGGRQLVRRHIVSETGIDETEESESECCE